MTNSTIDLDGNNLGTDASASSGSQSHARTPLFDMHVQLGAKMVSFAGYDMPVQYGLGVMGEHLHTREKAGLFDVSHMGQAQLFPQDPDRDVAPVFEALVPGGIISLKEGGIRYTQLTNQDGGILDDLMVTRFGNTLWLVVNAACKNDDFAHIAQLLAGKARLSVENRALLALQGPLAEAVLKEHLPAVADLAFMQACHADYEAEKLIISRCGYTGEDGFEISLPNEMAPHFAALLLANDAVAPIGLGARDSLRLEAGLCLYGHDIDTGTTPVEADLMWSVPRRRRESLNFPGAHKISKQLSQKPDRVRVGIKPEGRAPAREGTEIHDMNNNPIGRITSGGFAPSLQAPIAMGYVSAEHAAPSTQVQLIIRGKPMLAHITSMPFVEHKYLRTKS